MMKKIAQRLAKWNMEQRTIAELSMMTDRELSDIGISRYDIREIAKNG